MCDSQRGPSWVTHVTSQAKQQCRRRLGSIETLSSCICVADFYGVQCRCKLYRSVQQRLSRNTTLRTGSARQVVVADQESCELWLQLQNSSLRLSGNVEDLFPQAICLRIALIHSAPCEWRQSMNLQVLPIISLCKLNLFRPRLNFSIDQSSGRVRVKIQEMIDHAWGCLDLLTTAILTNALPSRVLPICESHAFGREFFLE